MHCIDSEDCAFGQINQTKIVPCQNDVPFSMEESCFTLTTFVKGNVKRGCTLDDITASESCDKNEHCKKCNGNGCNVENVFRDQCIKCESEIGGECSKLTGSTNFSRPCDSLYPFSERGCYTSLISMKKFFRFELFIY